MLSGTNMLSKRDLEAVKMEQRYRKARSSFYEYVQLANQGYIKTRFHEYLCNKVQAFVEDKNGSPAYDFLLLSVPPQHGKSITITQSLPSWYFGMHPDRDVIIASYNDTTATRFGISNREKLERFSQAPYDVVGALFSDFKAGSEWSANDIKSSAGGYIHSRGIMGGITSNPAHLFIIDDPIKTMEEATSDTTKDKVWAELLSSVTTRMKPHGKIIVIATRWSDDDIIGRIMEYFPASRITTIFFPCECVDEEHDPLGRKLGDTLCPELGRDKAWLADTKQIQVTEQGLYTWSALYQCDPTPIAGAIINPEWWRYYDYSEDLPFTQTYISVDCAFHDDDKSDYVVAQVWSMVGENYYLRTQIRDHLSFTGTLDAIRELAETYDDYVGILIEDKANGSAVIDSLQNEYDSIIPVNPSGGKVSRLHSVSKNIRKNRVFLPRGAIWLDSYIHEFTSFPNGKHDDQVDSTTQALLRMMYSVGDNSSNDDDKSAKIKIREWTQDMYEDYYNGNEDIRSRLIGLWGYPVDGFNEEEL